MKWDAFIKIGKATHLRRRLHAYSSHNPIAPQLALICHTVDAEQVEDHFLCTWAGMSTHGREWFPVKLWPDLEFVLPELCPEMKSLEVLSWQHLMTESGLLERNCSKE